MAYSPRGLPLAKSEGGQTTTYAYNAVGHTTHANLPGGKQLTFSYDANHQLLDVQLNGTSLADPASLRAPSGSALFNPFARHLKPLRDTLLAAIPSAHAQSISNAATAVPVPIPGFENPGRPSTDPWDLMMQAEGAKPPTADGIVRRLGRAADKLCEQRCDPNGYDRPTWSFLSATKAIIRGHVPWVLGISIPGQSAFVEGALKSNGVDEISWQEFVDEVVSKSAGPDKSDDGNLAYYVRDMGRQMGYSAGQPTRAVTLMVAPECVPKGRPWKRNEVVSFYPEKENKK
jgi:YD repeat-containing protein